MKTWASVETVWGAPKSNDMVKRQSSARTSEGGSENCSVTKIRPVSVQVRPGVFTMTKLETPSQIEAEIAKELRTEVLDLIERIAYPVELTAKRLGLLVPGVTVLLARKIWSLETAMRVAEANES